MVCLMFSYEQLEALIQDMARERVSLRGRLREKREESSGNLPGTLSEKRGRYFNILQTQAKGENGLLA